MAEFEYAHDGVGNALINLKVVEVNFKTQIINIEIDGDMHEVKFNKASQLFIQDCRVKASGTITVESDQL